MVTEGLNENQSADRAEGCPVNENNQLSEEEQGKSNAWSDGLSEDPLSKDRLDASWSQNSISKSLQRAEALLRTHFNPSLRWLLGGKAEDDPWDSESQDTFVAYQNLTSRSSLRLQRLEQGMLGASQQCQVVREPCTGFTQGWVRGLGTGEAGSVLYHPPSASLSQHYGQLQNLLEQRALLLFLHEYARRSRVASEYVARLAGFLEGELGELEDKDSPFLDRPNSALRQGPGLASLCQELRIHVRHWEALCIRARSDPYLRPVLLQRTGLLEGMRRTLGLLGLQALILMQRCVEIVLGALASSQLVRVPRDTLEDMLAAAELYNQVLEEQNAHRGTRVWRCQLLQGCGWSGLQGRPPGSRGKHPSPFPVVQLMRILAEHRGRMAAEQLHRWASQQNGLTTQILHPGTPTPTWEQLLHDFPLLPPLCYHLPPEPEPERHPVEEKPQAQLQSQPQPWSPDLPLGAFIRQDRRSLELLFQALVSSTELLAPHVSNRPAPDRHTPDWRLQTPDRMDRILYTPDRIDQILHRTDRHTPDRTDRPERTQAPEGSAVSQDGHRPSLPVNEETIPPEQARQEARRPRSVQWLDKGQSGACLQLFGQYRSLLWKQCGRALFMIFQHPPPGGTLGSINQWNDQMLFQLVLWLNQVCKTELVPEECKGVLDDFTIQLLTSTAFRHWDHVLCVSLGSGLKDKCLPRADRDGSMVITSTMEHFLQLTSPLLTTLRALSHTSNTHTPGAPGKAFSHRTELLQGSTMRALASVQTSTLWVMGKAYQFLSSWSLNKFLLVTQGDLKVLRASVESLLQEVETLAGEEDHPHHPIPPVLMRQQIAQLRQAMSHLQVFSEMVMRIFSMDCKKMSGEIFEQTMPSAKHWRLTYRMDFPRSPSEYASSAAQSVIGQVLEGVQPLPEEARVPALTEAMTAFMEAWMEHILKQKIKFSIQGALQLKQDFDLIRDLIRSEEYSLSEELHQSLLSLRVFQQVDSAIVCLLQQPLAKTYMPSRGWEPFRRCCPNSASVVDQAAGSMNNLESMEIGAVCQQALNQGNNSLTSDLPTTSPPESYLALGHAQQEWLDLRIHSGSRWRLPGLHCLSNTEP
ncbi:uncharacterized protein ccdc142 isoform X2 [Hypomesus transpacificus]|nr:uncharacterized protein ccdc142 isoform X2 [Hypomesus transpacificus]